MRLLQHYERMQAYIPDFTAESDAVFALNNMTALLERTDWKQVRKDILTTDADWRVLKEKLAFSDDFVEQNRETVTECLLQGGAAMVRALYGELDGQEFRSRRCGRPNLPPRYCCRRLGSQGCHRGRQIPAATVKTIV